MAPRPADMPDTMLTTPVSAYPRATTNEREAMLSLEAIAGRGRLVKPLENPERVVGAWVMQVAARQERGEAASILDHTALSYALRKDVFAKAPSDREAAVAALTASWKSLTGGVPKDIYGRIPHSVLRGARPIDQKFNACSFETPAMPKDAIAYIKILNELRKDYVLDKNDAIALSAIAAGTLVSPAGMGGVVAGYVFVTFNEYLYHLALGHPPKWLESYIEKPWMPKGVKKFFHQAWAAHRAHHFMTYRKSNYDQFDERMTKDAIFKIIERRYGTPVAESMARQGFGESFDLKNRLYFYIPTLAASAAMFTGLGWMSVPFFIGLAASTSLLQWGSAVQHVSDHDTAEDALKHESVLHSAYLRTRLAGQLATHHHVHHRYPNDNINLNLNPGADLVLGSQRRADMNDALEMFHHGSL